MIAEASLNSKQYDAYNSTSKEVCYLSGVGGGKTFLLAILTIKFASIKGSIGLISAPTFDTLRTATFKGITEAFNKLGLIDGVHYVIGIRPPLDWGVEPFSKITNVRVVTWRNGSYTILESLENFNKLRGTQFDYILVDEFRDIKFTAVRKVLIGRARGDCFISKNIKHQIYYVSTPPDDVRELVNLINSGVVDYIQGSSYDNRVNLPEGYIESLLATYDPLTAKREVYGLPVGAVTERQFAYSYDQNYHYTSFSEIKCVLNKSEPIKLAFDFNVNPVTCILGQSTHKTIRIFKAFSAPNSDTAALCDLVIAYLGSEKYTIFITGDANGYKRDTRSSINDYQIIKDKFELRKPQLLAPRMNASLRDSRVLCNAILSHLDLAINSDNNACRDLDDDLITVQVDDSGKLDKKKHGAHTLDNLRYYLHTWHYDFLKTKTK